MNTLNVNLDNLSQEERDTLVKLIEKSNKVEVKNSSKWHVPEFGEKYYIINSEGSTVEWLLYGHDAVDKRVLNYQRAFPSRELAEKESARMKARTKIFKFLRENEGDWVNSWLEASRNHCVFYNHTNTKLDQTYWTSLQSLEKGFYSNNGAIKLALSTPEIVEAYKTWLEVE